MQDAESPKPGSEVQTGPECQDQKLIEDKSQAVRGIRRKHSKFKICLPKNLFEYERQVDELSAVRETPEKGKRTGREVLKRAVGSAIASATGALARTVFKNYGN